MMATLIHSRATDGDASLRARAGQGGRSPRLRHRESHYIVRAAEGYYFRARDGGERVFHRPLRATVSAILPASLADVADIVVREWSERHLGSGRRGHDAARSLRRALGHDRPGRGPRGLAPTRSIPHDKRPRRRDRLRQHQRGLSERGENLSDPRHRRARRPEPGPPPTRGGRVWRPGPAGRRVLADPAIEVVLNLTVPKAHVEVGLRAIAAGKPVYSEKPLGVTVAEARTLIDAARAKGVRLGCAPDTFLGGAHQTARACLDEGMIGRPSAARRSSCVRATSAGIPIPAFYYLAGGGPMLDMGPYYVTDLVNLLGPVARVAGVATRTRAERVVTSAAARRNAHPRRDGDACDRRPDLRQRRGGVDDDELRRRAPQACPDRDLWRDRLADRPRPEFFRRNDRVRDGGRGLARGSDPARLCRRQLSHPRPRRHGAGDPRPAGRTGPAETSRSTRSR